MNSVYLRRQFVSHSLVLLGAAVFLPASRGLRAATPETAAAGTPETAALDFVRRYSPDASVAAGTATGAPLRIVAPVRDVAALSATLSAAHRHGIGAVRTAGSTATFSLGGRRIEVEHRFLPA